MRALTPVEAFAYASFEDFSLIDRIRRSLPANVFTVLLKMFELYISRALTKGKLLHIVEKLVHHKPKLVQEFARLLQTKAVIRGSGQSVVSGPDRSRMDMENRRALLKSREPDNRAAETGKKQAEIPGFMHLHTWAHTVGLARCMQVCEVRNYADKSRE